MPRSRKLPQKAYVILKKYLDIINPIFQHSQAVDADPERKTTNLFSLVIHKAIDRRIDHAGAEKFDPARPFALGANAATRRSAAARTENAGGIEFHRRLGKRKITRSETRFHARAEELLDEIFDGAGKIAKSDIRIDGETFNLVKHKGVRGIGIISPINFARNDHAHGRLLFFYGANLHGRSVSTKQQRTRSALGQLQIKRVHIVAHWMKFRNVEGFEIVIGSFNLRAFHDGEADGEENILDFLKHLANQVIRTDRTHDARQGEIHARAGELRFFRARFHRGATLFNFRLHVRA